MASPGGMQMNSNSSFAQFNSRSKIRYDTYRVSSASPMGSRNINNYSNNNDNNMNYDDPEDDLLEPNGDTEVDRWDPEQVKKWLVAHHLGDLAGTKIDYDNVVKQLK